MTRLCLSVLSVIAVLGLGSGRVLDRDAQSSGDRHNEVLELLAKADPSENDIFDETVPEMEEEPEPANSRSPTQHILEELSRPKYIDASEFRNVEVLPPALDINRQLTLLAASKRIRPPVEIVHQQEEPVLDEELVKVFYRPGSPLFRDDFPSESIDYIIEPLESEVVSNSTDKVSPRISTSVSVSRSISYSNGSSAGLNVPANETVSSSTFSTTIASITSATLSTTPIAKTSNASAAASATTTASSPVEKFDAESLPLAETTAEFSPLIAEEDPSYVVVGEYPPYVESDAFRLAEPSEYPVEGALSPLAHILAGFGGEHGPFGGDVRRDGFIEGFRPDGF
ncbi:pinin [Hyalella azteca]|uniref:Pinin n=1 Tax=Hyalella azteca TaxID=294128 RepID=A0A8B7PIM8_HYAAZ|nr:pinin [Hyalella azteca]